MKRLNSESDHPGETCHPDAGTQHEGNEEQPGKELDNWAWRID
jgi:hypothetical protein